TYTTGAQNYPNVRHLANGDFVVAWQGEPDGSSTGIAARRFSAAGSALGAPFQVNTSTTGLQAYPALAATPTGFVVTWSATTGDGSGPAVLAQRFDAAGGRLGAELLVNTYTTDLQAYSKVAATADGGFVVAWLSHVQDADRTNGIFGQRFAPDGARRGSEFQ